MSSDLQNHSILIGPAYAPALIQALEKAKREINIIMYVWSDYPDDPFNDVSRITHLILDAHRRGVKVRILTHFSEVKNRLSALGLDVKTVLDKNIVHAKMVTIDNEIAFVGSHNFSRSALNSNIELSYLIKTLADITKLNAYFNSIWQ